MSALRYRSRRGRRQVQRHLGRWCQSDPCCCQARRFVMAKAISPSELQKTPPPDAVIEAFNELIQKDWDGTEATVKQDAVVKLIISKMGLKAKERDKVFDNH